MGSNPTGTATKTPYIPVFYWGVGGFWEEGARGAVAHVRAANADNLHDTELQALVAELREQSPLFGEWWNEHIVERRRASLKHLRSQDGETLARR
ncbi:hypothetical protein E3O45_12275 [Cryobacterium sp. TMS1-20-1]|uniref:MmyB family transcriptional regulator n=1 Tax=Cryobacterium sp. TMS1-20-1 TaxID=1259223 RepID=UPI00106A3BD6|nr:hypothetical protein [Cryobacterium sp. TMS1-20-1]TFC73053.1 hypothetical protein E3O45_12275 [Cryobacterium sp. TMS1-20-1]